jgi:hypothetical protein
MSISSTRQRRFTPWLLLVGIFASVVAGCGGPTSQSSTTPPATPTPAPTKTVNYVAPQPCTSPAPDGCRFWVRGVIAVAVSLNPTDSSGKDLTQLITTTLNKQLHLALTPYGGSQIRIPPFMTVGAGAVLFLQDSRQDDASLLTDIDAINTAILAVNPNGLAAGYLPVDGSSAWIVGASPDWYGTPAQAGGEHVHGSPDGPPQPTSPTTAPVHTAPAGTALGAGPSVYVLDTGYRDVSSYPAQGVSVLFDDLRSVWSEKNALSTLNTDEPGPGEMTAPYEFDQENPSLATATPAPAYAPSNYLPVNVVDHGVAISALIHALAPAAHIYQSRVLNDYGVGDLQALVFTLNQLYPSVNSNAILNLSLNYGPPMACMVDYWNTVKGGGMAGASKLNLVYDTSGCRKSDYTIGGDSRRYLTLGLVLAAFMQGRQDIVVAAAGNASGGGMHAATNMPAIYCGVVATGAVTTPEGSTLTPFSNRPDSSCMAFQVAHTESTGLYRVTLGRPITALALGQNVCSLHFAKLLPYDAAPPANHLALWSGTSFATALVTGNIAANRSIVPASGAVPIARQTVPCTGG